MVFQLGKTKTADDEAVRQETFQRWREASERHQAEIGSSAPDANQTQPQETQLELGDVAVSPNQPAQNAPGQNPAAEANQPNPYVEEIKMDSMRAVEWPDPRATISLTQEIIDEVPLDKMPPKSSTVTRLNPPPRSTTSKLAHFVSSGFSAGLNAGLSATGLLGGASRPAAAAAPSASTPAPVSASGKPNVEVIRTVADTPLEIERRPIAPSHPAAAASPAAPASTGSSIAGVSDDIRQRFGANIRSALGPGTIIEGTFSFDSPVCIEGTLIGEVRSNSVLIVGAQATVNAKVRVGSLIVFGTVHGDVESEELVEVKNGGLLEGDVLSRRFAMEDGAWFQGRCRPTIPPRKAPVQEEESPAVEEELAKLSEKWSID